MGIPETGIGTRMQSWLAFVSREGFNYEARKNTAFRVNNVVPTHIDRLFYEGQADITTVARDVD